jgi:signal peptidase I
MGDNRGNSKDSRFIGTIPKNLIVGRAFVRVWPLSGIGLL